MSNRRYATTLMSRQYGLLSSRQLHEHHFPETYGRSQVRAGIWERRRPGVFAVAGMPESVEQATLAVVLCVGEDTVASHATAGILWRLPKIITENIEVSSPLARRIELPGVRAHRSCLLFDEDVTRHRRIPVTTMARTIVDLSSRFTVPELGSITDHALRQGMRLDDLRRCIGRLPPAPGRRPKVIHAVLGKRLKGYDPGDSDLETEVLRWLVEAGFPPPRQQFRVRMNGRTYKIDLAYPELRIAIELDSWEWHGMGLRTPFDHDRTKITQLSLAGWHPIIFTSSHTREYVIESVTEAWTRFGG